MKKNKVTIPERATQIGFDKDLVKSHRNTLCIFCHSKLSSYQHYLDITIDPEIPVKPSLKLDRTISEFFVDLANS